MSEKSLANYDALIRSHLVSDESVHEMIARRGLEVLDRDFPYLLTVARGLRLSEMRTDARRRSLLELNSNRSQSVVDPLSAVLADEGLRSAVESLFSLDDADAAILWWSAAEVSDEEIAERLFSDGLTGECLNRATIRQRRSRARRQLRKNLLKR